MPPQRDPELALDALATGLTEPQARKISGNPSLDHADPRYTQARKAGAIQREAAKHAPHLLNLPEPLPEERWWEYGELVAGGDLPSTAAQRMGVRPVEVYLARNKFPQFREFEAACEAIASEDVEAALKLAALDTSTPHGVRAATEWLRNRSRDRWQGDGPAVQVNVNVDPEQARERLEQIRREWAIDADSEAA
jgi:hypothetical protein